MGLPGAFSSSVLLVSTISLSSVEITCCCLRGFFLGEAPGIKSPVAGVFRVEAWVVRVGADDMFTLGSEGMHKFVLLFLFSHVHELHRSHEKDVEKKHDLTWLRGVHCLHLLFDFHIWTSGAGCTSCSTTCCRLSGGGHSVGH